ncbi:MAG: XRE family transcriptional regulator [Clostridiales bacterium]|nr:XRE family transcriptional regulator [Clostridiales bacterium]
MYYLKLSDKILLSFDMEQDLSLKITNISIVSDRAEFYPELLKEDITAERIEAFLKGRIIPNSRAFVKEILDSQNLSISNIKAIIDVCKGLSLNDSYWIVNDDSLSFNDCNLYDNDFPEEISEVAFTGQPIKAYSKAISPELTTNGALPKAWRRIDNNVYLYKGSTEAWNFSNTGFEPYSEYYASQIADAMGIDAVEYDLKKWKGMLASVCPIFTSKELSYVPIWQASGKRKIDEIYDWCEENGFGEQFSDMIVFDSLIYNPDRHLQNFGVLKDSVTGEYVEFAPLFDNGEGLLSKGSKEAFTNRNAFWDYMDTADVNTSQYGVDYLDLVDAFCGKEQIAKLRKVLDFKFIKHPKYNLPDNRLELIEDMVRERANELILTIENSPNYKRNNDIGMTM